MQVLQITYTLFRCLQHEATREVLLNHTQVAYAWRMHSVCMAYAYACAHTLSVWQVVSYVVDLLYIRAYATHALIR